jgi:quercetin dioxygenase-like cupin family protein
MKNMNKIQSIHRTMVKDSEIIVEGNGKSIVESNITPLKHSFADQVYIRQMEMKKGTIVLGAVHNHEHVWFLLTGHLTISSNDEVQDYESPCYVVSKAGSQRAIYANEDSIFVNIHKNPDNIKDISKLEKQIVSVTKEDFNKYKNKKL